MIDRSIELPKNPYEGDTLYQDYDLRNHCDIHNHCETFSFDGGQTIDEQIAWARKLGFRHHTLSDHFDKGHLDRLEGTITLTRDREKYPKIEDEPGEDSEWIFSIEDYFKTLRAKQEELAKEDDPLELLIGIELGYFPEIKDDLNAMVERWPFDLVIGSAHSYDGGEIWSNRAFYNQGKEKAYAQYLERLIEITKELDCDVLGHFDYVTRYNDYAQPKYRYDEFPDLFDTLFRTLIDEGVSFEINTGTQVRALDTPAPTRSYPLDEVDLPDPKILERYKDLGGELISIASDGHYLGHGARLFKENLAYLDSLGFKYVFYYRERKPVAVPIHG